MGPHLTITHAEAEKFQIQLLFPRRIQVEAAVISNSETSPCTHNSSPREKSKQSSPQVQALQYFSAKHQNNHTFLKL